MWWLWPHFKRVWAVVGTVTLGLVVNYLSALWVGQSIPSLQRLSHFLSDSWYLTGGVLIPFAIFSLFAKRAHWLHSRPGFPSSWREREKQPSLPPPIDAASTLMVGREGELEQLRDWYASVIQGERRVSFGRGGHRQNHLH